MCEIYINTEQRNQAQSAMGNNSLTVVCIKKVREGMPEDEWDETMPLPGDIIESVSTSTADKSEGALLWAPRREESGPVKGKSELSSLLRRINKEGMELVWVRVRRGDAVLNLKARVAPDKRGKIHRKFTLKAARDDRHIAVLADLTLDECSELQEMSRSRIVHIDTTRFEKNKGIDYDWKKTVGTYLPDHHSTVISSILFMPLSHERSIEPTTTRCMAWFSAAVSSGAPLIFVNIQTEQTSAKGASSDAVVTRQTSWRELSWGRQQSPRKSTAAEMVHGVRLWFLPGVAEVLVVLTMEPNETRLGMDMKRTEEGFVCITSVSKGSAADRAGLRELCREASRHGHLVVISRLEGNSVTPSLVSSDGLIHCCESSEIKDGLANAMHRGEDIRIHIMAWPELKSPTQTNDQHSNRRDMDPSFLKL